MGLVEAGVLMLDCAEPEELAEFYRTLLDGEIHAAPGSDRVDVIGERGTHLAFRRDLNATPASWPRPDDSQQAHLDFLVPRQDMDEVERLIIGLGARPIETRGARGPQETRVYSDPAGHPFAVHCAERPAPKAH
ncbi:VOC family protein [Streptomyces sp. VRA16 Mangrove soil]|uniref:VOC family protein n=1 Tax=Streptomyces sp. VRA16 Mangrove soil TaxID=2817434 RepID=UPI001A9E06E6|nr:VOC family protein [Streptomyces sp. VRA16 Mangrove soil]MBO1332987.1 VOC family protein [Streptomyces sp. VRA16 Mangrove soil]